MLTLWLSQSVPPQLVSVAPAQVPKSPSVQHGEPGFMPSMQWTPPLSIVVKDCSTEIQKPFSKWFVWSPTGSLEPNLVSPSLCSGLWPQTHLFCNDDFKIPSCFLSTSGKPPYNWQYLLRSGLGLAGYSRLVRLYSIACWAPACLMLSSGKFLSWIENPSPKSNYSELDIVLLLYCRVCNPHWWTSVQKSQSREYFQMPKCALSQAGFKKWS